jgi:anti-sigma-K factor RskA
MEHKPMAHNQCASFLENIPAYALGALDADEATSLEAHLRTCDSCPAELSAYHTISESLLTALPPQFPPAALRQRLQQRLPDERKSQRLWPARFSWAKFALGVAIVSLILLQISSLLQIQALQNQQAQIVQEAQTEQMVLAIMAYPTSKSFPIWADGISGRLLLDEHHNVGALILWNLPLLPEDQTYQAWLIDPKGDRTSAGLFRPKAGQALTSEVLTIPQDLSFFTGLGVTIEPAGGVDLPVGPRIFKIDF